MSKKNKKQRRSYGTGIPFKNDVLSRQLNKYFGLPEDYEGSVSGPGEEIAAAQEVFGALKIEKIPKTEKAYSP